MLVPYEVISTSYIFSRLARIQTAHGVRKKKISVKIAAAALAAADSMIAVE